MLVVTFIVHRSCHHGLYLSNLFRSHSKFYQRNLSEKNSTVPLIAYVQWKDPTTRSYNRAAMSENKRSVAWIEGPCRCLLSCFSSLISSLFNNSLIYLFIYFPQMVRMVVAWAVNKLIHGIGRFLYFSI